MYEARIIRLREGDKVKVSLDKFRRYIATLEETVETSSDISIERKRISMFLQEVWLRVEADSEKEAKESLEKIGAEYKVRAKKAKLENPGFAYDRFGKVPLKTTTSR